VLPLQGGLLARSPGSAASPAGHWLRAGAPGGSIGKRAARGPAPSGPQRCQGFPARWPAWFVVAPAGVFDPGLISVRYSPLTRLKLDRWNVATQGKRPTDFSMHAPDGMNLA
jgi:hypothetical protein